MTPLTKLLSTAGAALGASAAAAAVLAERLDGLGTRDGEAGGALDGDDLRGPGARQRTRAITIAAPPADVWPLLDELGPGIPVADEDLFEVVRSDPHQHRVAVYEGASVRVVRAMVLRDFDEATRLVVRTSFETSGPAARLAVRVLVDPVHAATEVVQLRRIKRRAEGYDAPATTAAARASR